MTMTRTAAVLPTADQLPPELVARPHWVAWRIELDEQGTPKKVPYSPNTNVRASPTDSETWTTFDNACAFCRKLRLDGVGYVFVKGEKHTGIDLDHCLVDGVCEPWALAIVERFVTYTEISPSGEGLHLFVGGELPAGSRHVWVPEGATHPNAKIEVYSEGRYFTVTGTRWEGAPLAVCERQAALADFHSGGVGGEAVPAPLNGSVNGSVNGSSNGIANDDELIRRAMRAKDGILFDRLWRGDWQGAGYPSQSEADLALCNLLAFWTGRDAGRIDRLFRQSRLYRPQWDRTGRYTIPRAIADTAAVYAEEAQLPVSLTDLDDDDDDGGGEDEGEPGRPGPAASKPKRGEKYHATDVGNGERLVALFGRDLRYCYEWRAWLVWDGRRWKKDNTGEAERWAKLTARTIWRDLETADEDERKPILKAAMRAESLDGLHAMLGCAAFETGIAITPDQLDTDIWKLNCLNGTVDLHSGGVTPHDRADLITKLVPIEYDLAAPAAGWERFLAQILPDAAVREFVQRAAGYSATGKTSERILLIPHGGGKNGKSKFLNLLRAALGDYAMATPVETIVERKREGISNDIARLKGARLVTTSESEEGKRLSEATVKQMTGDEVLTARFMRAEFFDFRPEFTPWMATNHKPVIRGTDDAIWDRVKLIPFGVRFWDRDKGESGPPELEADKEIEAKLLAELPGILAWIVQGCLLWQIGGLTEPPAVRAAGTAYRAEMDTLGAFLDECCVLGETKTATAKELYATYKTWCEESGEKPQSQRWFGLRLRERGFDNTGHNRTGNYWLGLGLLSGTHGTEL